MEHTTSGSSTVYKALSVLEALAGLARQHPDGVSLTELGRQTGFTPSSTFRYLRPLLVFGLVAQDPANGRYRLGVRVVELAGVCLQSLSLRNIARPYLEELTRRTQETAYLGVPDGLEVVYLDRIDSPLPLRPHTNLGGRNPLHSTSLGKAMLALDPELLGRVIGEPLAPKTERTLVNPQRLLSDLQATRDRGYAVDDRENEEEMRCVGGAVRDHDGAVVAAVSISGPATRMTLERIETQVGPLVREAVKEISRALGYDPAGSAHERLAAQNRGRREGAGRSAQNRG